MKRILFIILIALALVFVLGVYLADLFYFKTSISENGTNVAVTVVILFFALLRTINNVDRKGLPFYEKAYERELGSAFKGRLFPRKRLLCACRYYSEGNYRKALKNLFPLLKKAQFERDAVPVLLFIALCYTDVGLHEQAMQAYHKLLEFQPSNETAHNNLGHLYMSEGDYETALKHFDEALTIQPWYYYAYLNRADCYLKRGDYEAAIRDAKRALKEKNGGTEALSLLTILYALLEDTEQQEHYYQAAVAAGENPWDLDRAILHFRHKHGRRDNKEESETEEEFDEDDI